MKILLYLFMLPLSKGNLIDLISGQLNFIKSIFCIVFLLGLVVTQTHASSKYVIQTDFVEMLWIHEADKNIDYQIPAYIKLSGGFLVECANPSSTYIVNNDKDKNINFRILHLDSGKNSKSITLVPGDKISFERVLEYYAESYLWSSMESMYDSIVSFFNETRYGVVTKGKAAFLQTDDTELEFKVINPNFLKKENVKLSWDTSLKIKHVIIEFNDRKIGKIKNILSNEISFGQLSKSTQKKLIPGNTYTLKILLADKSIHQTQLRILDKQKIESLYHFNKTL